MNKHRATPGSKQTFVISLGGSLIAPDEVDINFLKKFRRLITRQTRAGRRFIISPGGGKTCRRYQQALNAIIQAKADDLDWIGLSTNKFHAKFLQLMFKTLAGPVMAENPNKKLPFTQKVLIGAGGWKPGRSSDDFSVRLAKIYGAKTVINLSNIDYVYTKDPRKFHDAKKISSISWPDFLKLIGRKWDPGKNVPFDPTAAQFAMAHGIKVVIANGKNLANLSHILAGKNFKGTTIL
ncbi:MAG: UMP kinase [Patescibacteria group bacterium]|nr:UMP kinase [Patescibacteria group bacterium]